MSVAPWPALGRCDSGALAPATYVRGLRPGSARQKPRGVTGMELRLKSPDVAGGGHFLAEHPRRDRAVERGGGVHGDGVKGAF